MSGNPKMAWVCGMLGMALVLPGVASSSELERRLERLELELEDLREQLRQERGFRPEPSAERPEMEPSTPAEHLPQGQAWEDRRGVDRASGHGEASVRYFLEAEPMGPVPPATPPRVEGLLSLEGALGMNPVHYGVAEAGLFRPSRYRDPSVYRSVGVALEGYLDIPRAGGHRFLIAPKPAREGGGSPVVNEMIVQLVVNGEAVIELEGIRSWRNLSMVGELAEGRQPFTLWVVSNSPGYGPSPIDSRLEIGVNMPGRAEMTPIWRLMSPAHD